MIITIICLDVLYTIRVIHQPLVSLLIQRPNFRGVSFVPLLNSSSGGLGRRRCEEGPMTTAPEVAQLNMKHGLTPRQTNSLRL